MPNKQAKERKRKRRKINALLQSNGRTKKQIQRIKRKRQANI